MIRSSQAFMVSLLFCANAQVAAAETLSGLPYITDADTITISGTRIRLAGIDAPEMGQVCLDKAGREYRCGEAAREALTKVAAGLTWTCELLPSPDRYGRRVGTCRALLPRTGEQADVQSWLVRAGWALDWPRYSHGRYAADQDAAQVAGRGLWAGAFHAPWDWRHRTCKTEILGAATVPIDARTKLCR